jgi:hypothetical protein
MFCHEEQRRQRSLHRSRPRGIASQDKQGPKWRLHHPLSFTRPYHFIPLDILIVSPFAVIFSVLGTNATALALRPSLYRAS